MTNPLEPYQQRYREANAVLNAFDTNTLTTFDGKPDDTAITAFAQLFSAGRLDSGTPYTSCREWGAGHGMVARDRGE